MASLADLPELIGFFSYSRDDDRDSYGALSALRGRIQAELRGLLGRTGSTFRLWQDKEAIPSGTLWETEINNAVAQAAFFVPIITPTVVSSPYCRFELDAFLGREADLGRSDLVFPILYIDIPALQNEARRQADPVLSLIARRQYFDWREFRYLDINATEVRQAIGRFCVHIRDALQRSWVSPEELQRQEEIAAQQRRQQERRRQEAEAVRQAKQEEDRARERAAAERTAEERRKQAADAKQLAEERERRRQAEKAAQQRADEERRVREAEARRRAIEERRPSPVPPSQPSRRAVVIGAGVIGAGAVAAFGVIASRQQAPKPSADSPSSPANPSPVASAGPSPNASDNPSPAVADNPSPGNESYRMKITGGTINDAPHLFMKNLAAALQKDSSGRIKPEVYPAGQLGSIPRLIDAAQAGIIEAVNVPAEFLVGIDERFEVMAAPGLVNSMEQGQRLAAEPAVLKLMLGLGTSKGLRVVGLYVAYPGCIVSKAPIRRLADFKGKKIRVVGSRLQTAAVARLGATPVTTGLLDVLPALQQGTIDGAVFGIGTLVGLHIQDAAKYVVETNQPTFFMVIAVSRKWYDSLPGALQRIVDRDGLSESNAINAPALDIYQQQRQAWTAAGGELLQLPPDDQAEMMRMLASVGDDVFKAKAELRDAYLTVKQAARRT